MYSIYISTFGKPVIKVHNGIPIEVGASMRKNFIYELHDNVGDNISSENPFYGELTGLYWIWKNIDITPDDIIGFCHFNKALRIKKKNAEKWLKSHTNGWITLLPNTIRDHPVPDEVGCVISLLKNMEGGYYDSWFRLYDATAASLYDSCRGGNTFITTGRQFKLYCEWLFPIMSEMRCQIGDKLDSDAYWKRYCAYMGERLLSVYIEANGLPALGVKYQYKKWWIPILGKVRRMMGISKDAFVYKYLHSYLGYHSSYRK